MEGEEELLLDAFRSVLEKFSQAAPLMILAPRHPERFAGGANFWKRRDAVFWRRSTWTDKPLGGGVLLLDSNR